MNVLEKLLSTLKEKRRKSKWLKWFWWAVVGIVALLLIGILTFELMSKSKKVAKALHKIDVLEEQRNLSKANAKVAESQVEYDKHIKKVEKLENKLKTVRKQGNKADVSHKEATALIEKIQSWDDVDKTIKH